MNIGSSSPKAPNSTRAIKLDRLEKIESQIAFLERQYDELNSVVIQQSKTILRLQMQLDRANEALETAELERIRANNPKPPHYQ